MRQVKKRLQQGDYAFSIDPRKVYLQIHVFKCHHYFFTFCLAKYLVKVLQFGWATVLGISLYLLNPYFILAGTRFSY